MISKEQLRKTLVRYWSTEDHSFIAQSSLMPHVFVGVGETAQEASAEFEDALEDNFEEVIADNVAGYKIGRPAKGYVAFNANIRPSSKRTITELSRDMDISQGEVVDYLVFYRECKVQELDLIPKQSNVFDVVQVHAFNTASMFDSQDYVKSVNMAHLDAAFQTFSTFSMAAYCQPILDKTRQPGTGGHFQLAAPLLPGIQSNRYIASEDKVGS